ETHSRVSPVCPRGGSCLPVPPPPLMLIRRCDRHADPDTIARIVRHTRGELATVVLARHPIALDALLIIVVVADFAALYDFLPHALGGATGGAVIADAGA